MQPGLTRDAGAHAADRARRRRRRRPRATRRRSSTSTSPPTAARSRSPPQRTVFPLGSPAFVSAPGRRTRDGRTVRRRPRRRHAHARHPRLSRAEASEHPHQPVVAGEDPYTATGRRRALAVVLGRRQHARLLLDRRRTSCYGDGNTPPLGSRSRRFDGSDAFVVSRVLFGATPTPQYDLERAASPRSHRSGGSA